jgi:outer membrane protein assembly factor BamB
VTRDSDAGLKCHAAMPPDLWLPLRGMRRLRLPRESRAAWLVAAALVVVAIVVAGIAIHDRSKPTGTHDTGAKGFTASNPTSTTPVSTPSKFIWPMYGLNDARTRVYNGPAAFNDPSALRAKWHVGGNAPLEFPPVIDGNALFFLDDNATLNKVNATTGRRYWRYRIGMLSSATPTLDVKLGLLFVPILSDTSDVINSVDGSFAAVSMKSGKVIWRDPVPSGTESSPLVWGDNVYFGDKGGTVYDVNAKTGAQIWSFPTGGPEKAGPTLAHGDLYFGNYAGQLFDVNASTGKQIWEDSLGGALYASPTLAYGLVYVGSNTSGVEYALSQKTGDQVWSLGTGDDVYSSAAADTVRGLGPTVYFGSYTGHVYAVNAANGDVDWTDDLGDSISGAASIVNNTVFFSGVYNLPSGHTLTKGYDVTTGKQVFYYPDGAYTATVASPNAVYLMGHYTLYGLFPAK